jgi:hypothetical protein
VTLPAALALLAIYEKRSRPLTTIPLLKLTFLLAAVAGVVAFYLALRSHSGAAPFSLHAEGTYTYLLSVQTLWSNFLEYSWRTYGMLIIIGGALALSRRLSGARIRFNLLTRNEVAFSILLCAIMISPFMLLRYRSGIYTYMPAVASAILLGAAVRSFYQPDDNAVRQFRAIAVLPVLLVIATFTIFMVGQSQRWIMMAKTTTEVLSQISVQVPRPQPNTYFVLKYTEVDRKNRFPNGFATWSFPSALRLNYGDATLDGMIVLADDSFTPPSGSPVVNLVYTTELDRIRIVKRNPD